MKTLFPEIRLQVPATTFTSAYARVRADPRLGPVLDRHIIPALEKAGQPEDRLAAFERQRVAAIGLYYRSVGAAGEPYLTQDERCSRNTGPGPHAALDALDRVAYHLIDAWFMALARRVATSGLSKSEIDTALARLESLAPGAIPWKPSLSDNIIVGLTLLRAAVSRGQPIA